MRGFHLEAVDLMARAVQFEAALKNSVVSTYHLVMPAGRSVHQFGPGIKLLNVV